MSFGSVLCNEKKMIIQEKVVWHKPPFVKTQNTPKEYR